ncbi:MAG: tetratricopeptide repeat protein, partial [Luteimonas sp.]
MLRWLVSILLMLLPSLVLAGKPPAIVPGDPALILERLPSGYAALEPSASGKPAPPLTHAVQLLTIASRTGDARLAARADAMLSRFPANDDSPAVLRARAFSAQHRHDFAAALQLLDKLITKDPRDGDARLSRIQLQLVQGRLDRARSDCGSLALGVDSDLGLLCAAAISLRTGNTDAAAAMTDRWLAGAKTDPETRRYVLVMRAEIASRAGSADADQWFQQALALAPGDVRTLAAYARHLRATGRNRAVLTLLTDASNNDGLQLQRALAALAAHDPSAPAL